MSNRFAFVARGNTAELLIYGNIGEDEETYENEVSAKQVVTQLDALNDAPVLVRINSRGGDLDQGLAIYSALRRHAGTVTTRNEGLAASIAGMHLMAGDVIEMAENAILMIHGPSLSGFVQMNEKDLGEAIVGIRKYSDAMVGAYTRRGSVDKGTVEGWLRDGVDHRFGATEALQLGLIDKIEGQAIIPPASSAVGKSGVFASDKLNEEPQPMADKAEKPAAVLAAQNTAPGGATPNAGTPEFLAQHATAVAAGAAQGAATENARQREVRGLFYGSSGGFIYGSDSDPADPMVALMDHCISDVSCDANGALRRINEAMRSGVRPIISPIAQAQGATGGSHGAYSRAPGVGNLGGWGDVGIVADAGDKFVAGATEALEVRTGLTQDRQKVAAARESEFLGMSVADLCRHELRLKGMRANGGREDVIRRVIAAAPGQGTDHLPAILENIANKSVMDRFVAAPESWPVWTTEGTLPDYRESSRVNKSLMDKLDKMEEGAAFENGAIADVKQSIIGVLHGKRFSLTLQAMVNDELGVLTEDMGGWGESASATIGDAVFLVAFGAGSGGYGQTMDEDSTLLFHADHGNYVASGSGTPPGLESIGAGRSAMMTQIGPGDRVVASRPQYIIHPTSLTPDVWTLVNAVTRITGADTTVGDRNWVQSQGLQSAEEYRLDTALPGAWMLAASRRAVEVAFVQGQNTPRVDRNPTQDIPGLAWDVSIPFGVAALDWRTMYLNAGS